MAQKIRDEEFSRFFKTISQIGILKDPKKT